ncbi:hypothetical protein [Polyangium mundeleinium]|uniref:Uncharacterized protein n=1 Tax=Polyangium mundeleinium TaxID=2995306 RepID=A0ABT5EU00_9BACT|nr:hypothetical protein [Polyangium mundeleinium]MDC0745305.1 hypothetical protein [Polyangium mundeleinium]
MGHPGVERRKNCVYVTRNTEYHMRDGVCVAVRDRRTGKFVPAHIAVSLKLEGGVRLFPNGAVIPRIDKPGVGDAIWFATAVDASRQLVTSRIEAIERPSKDIVASYA